MENVKTLHIYAIKAQPKVSVVSQIHSKIKQACLKDNFSLKHAIVNIKTSCC